MDGGRALRPTPMGQHAVGVVAANNAPVPLEVASKVEANRTRRRSEAASNAGSVLNSARIWDWPERE
jgi:hypothetical protein